MNNLDNLSLTSREEIKHHLFQNRQDFTILATISLLTDGMRFYEATEIILIIKYVEHSRLFLYRYLKMIIQYVIAIHLMR